MGEFDKAIKIIMSEPPEPRYPTYYAGLLREADISCNTVCGMKSPDKDKVSDLLCHIYSIQSPHLDAIGVIAKKHYCEELWKELFGKESELPGWMT